MSEKRLSLLSNGKVRYELKTPYRDGTTNDRLAAVLGELGGTQMAVISLLREIGEDTNETSRHERR